MTLEFISDNFTFSLVLSVHGFRTFDCSKQQNSGLLIAVGNVHVADTDPAFVESTGNDTLAAGPRVSSVLI